MNRKDFKRWKADAVERLWKKHSQDGVMTLEREQDAYAELKRELDELAASGELARAGRARAGRSKHDSRPKKRR